MSRPPRPRAVAAGTCGAIALAAACAPSLPPGWIYATRVTPTAAAVVWTDDRAPGVTCRGVNGGTAAAAGERRGGVRVAGLEGLHPDTPYRCRLDGVASPGRVRFRTAPRGERTFHFAAVGDTGDGSPTARALARRILAGRPAFLVHLGDLSYTGERARGYERGFFGPYRKLLARVPFFPTPGNHDVGRRSVYGAVFAPVADVVDRGGPRYAFDWGAATIVSVSSMGLATSEATAGWLDAALARAAPERWRILALHEPPWVPGAKVVTAGLRAAAERLLAGSAPPALLLAGHEHLYARSDPLCRRAHEGTIEIVSGGGGANLDAAHAPAVFPIAVSATSYARVTVGAQSIVVRAVDVDGRVRDRVRIRRGAPLECRRDGWPPPHEKVR